MKKKPEKKKDMEALRAELGKSDNVFLTSYEKLTVAQDFELRKTVRGAGASARSSWAASCRSRPRRRTEPKWS